MSGFPKDIPIIVLAGGFGTRLRALESEKPKPMIEVCGRPFLYWLIDYWYRQGCRWFLLSTGYKSEQIANYPWARCFPEAAFSIYREEKPLGTGGAVRAIYSEYPTLDRTLVVNGDTLLSESFPEIDALVQAVENSKDAIFAVQGVSQLFDAQPNLVVNQECVREESENGNYFDAGTVLVTRRAVQGYTGAIPCKLTELLQPLMSEGRIGYTVVPGSCYDIGTPDRYRRFETFLKEIFAEHHASK